MPKQAINWAGTRSTSKRLKRRTAGGMTAGKGKEQAAVLERQADMVFFVRGSDRRRPRLREPGHNALAFPN
jgi:hypothetical protein